MARRCAFLTLENPDGFFIYDHLAMEPLRELGWLAEEVPWTQTRVRWSDFDAVVIRSTWDYQNAPARFLDTLETIEAAGPMLLNHLSICAWNMQKTYLRDLAERGVATVPTAWPCRLDEPLVPMLMRDLASDRIVVKPVIGANADDTFVLSREDRPTAWKQALRVFADKPLMAQPFLDSIVAVGEYSLFYFGGHYSHAILKTPRRGDFRVQEEHGGVIRSVLPDSDLRETGRCVMKALSQELLYARVDLARLADGSPSLIELELIEPSLYFNYDDQSAGRFAQVFYEMTKSLV